MSLDIHLCLLMVFPLLRYHNFHPILYPLAINPCFIPFLLQLSPSRELQEVDYQLNFHPVQVQL
jgi:hypothetical protein